MYLEHVNVFIKSLTKIKISNKTSWEETDRKTERRQVNKLVKVDWDFKNALLGVGICNDRAWETVASSNYLDLLENLSIHSYKDCSLASSSNKTEHHYTAAWLCVNLLISISQTRYHTPWFFPVTDINDFKDKIAATIATVDVHGLKMHVVWTLYVWRMAPMLHVCNIQNKL